MTLLHDPTITESQFQPRRYPARLSLWGNSSSGEYDDFRLRLTDLASGLTSLDGVGGKASEEDWADADYMLDKGLNRAEAASSFELAFHRYVVTACRILGIDAFVLAIDDVDTWFEKGWPVLEALRKYLVTPHLKIIMAGDMSLYNILVRQEQWKQMASISLDYEAKTGRGTTYLEAVVDMIDTLQDQYLVKIARPENRVYLRPLLHVVDEDETVFTSSRPTKREIPERELSTRYARRLLALSAREDVRSIRSTMFRLPVRSSLQALSGAWALLCADGPRGVTDGDVRAASEALRFVVSTRLMVQGLGEVDLAEPDPERILGVLASWMTRRGTWTSMARFHPDGADEDADVVAIFVASTLVSLFRRRPRLMFDYWLRICTVREMIDRSEVDQDGLPQLEQHLRATTTERTPHFVGRLAAWEARGVGRQLSRGIRVSGANVASSRLKEPASVILQLYGSRSLDREAVSAILNGTDEGRRKRLIQVMPAPLRGYHDALTGGGWRYTASGKGEAGLALSLANSTSGVASRLRPGSGASFAWALPTFEVSSPQRYENGVFSLPRLLAVLGELLDVTSSPGTTREGVEATLARFSHLRSYPTPSTASGSDDEDTEDAGPDAPIDEVSAGDEDEARDDLFVDALTAWLASYEAVRGDAALAPLHLGRIWTRYGYAFSSIREKLRLAKTRYLGVLMHRQVVAFLHAVGVESLRASDRLVDTKVIGNPVESSEPFLDLLASVERLPTADAHMSFFRFMFACPIWGFYLARSDEDLIGTSARQSATAMVFERYKAAVVERTGILPDFAVHLRHPSGGATAEFRGLFHVLNSVPFQGLNRGHGGTPSGSPPPTALDRMIQTLSKELVGGTSDGARPTRVKRGAGTPPASGS